MPPDTGISPPSEPRHAQASVTECPSNRTGDTVRPYGVEMFNPQRKPEPAGSGASGGRRGRDWENAAWIGILAVSSLLNTARHFGGPDLRPWSYVAALGFAALGLWIWRSRRAEQARELSSRGRHVRRPWQ